MELSQSLISQYLGKYFTLINVPVGIIITLGMAATPAIAAARALGNYKDIRAKTNLILKVGMLFAAPSAVGMMLYGRQLMALIYRNSPDGGELLVYGGICIIFITIAQLTAGILQGMGKQQVPTLHAAIACGVKVLLNLILIPRPQLHIYSVIHSTTICYLIFAVLNVYYIKREIGLKLNYTKLFIRPVMSAAVMGISSYAVFWGINKWVSQSRLVIVGIIPIAALIYLFTGLVTRTITLKDIRSVPGGAKILRKLGY
jgi:stage V sporulation protein B